MVKAQPTKTPLFALEIDAGPIYELLMTLDIAFDTFHADETYTAGAAWLAALRARVPADLRAAMSELDALDFVAFGGHKVWSNLTGLAYACPAPRDVPTFIAQLQALTPLELRLVLAGFYLRGARRLVLPDLMLQAAQGNRQAQAQLAAAAPAWREIVRVLFAGDAAELQGRVVGPLLKGDAERRRAWAPAMSSERLIETATNGLEFIPEPGYRNVLLIPTFTSSPWIITTEYRDTKIFYYPLADEIVQQGDLPPVNLVRMYRALAAERRLRILKLLVQREP